MTKSFSAFIGLLILSLLVFSVPVLADDAKGEAGEKESGNENEIELLVPFPDDEPILVKEPDSKRKGAIYIMEQYVSKFYVFGAGFVSIIAVIWIIIGGYEIMFSGATSAGDISAGKDKITKALLGLVVVFLTALILHTINPEFFAYSE